MRLSYRYNGRMRQALKVHPDSLCSAVTDIEVEIMRPCAGSLILSYLVTGSIGDLRIPVAVAAARTDELWPRHSSALRPAPAITNSTLRPQHNGRHIGSIASEAGCVLQPR
jgi:hypothetical protein